MIQRLVGCFTLLLLTVTHPLWSLPPAIENPQIPWFAWGGSIPFGVDVFFLWVGILASLALCLLPNLNRFRGAVLPTYAACFSCLVLLDQHRLQPWVLQFVLMAIVLGLSQPGLGMKCCQWIVISIYFYSAISKFDSSFYESHGQLLLDGLLKAIQIDGSFWMENFRKLLAMLFPIGELLVLLLLVFNRSLRWGVVLSWGMHLAIVLAVGPLGLNHEYGVLLWNAFFMLQNYVLFWSKEVTPQEETGGSSKYLLFGNRMAVALTILFFALPALENWGWYDHWPAWAVYSSRPEKVTIFVDQDATEDFPKFLQELCGPPLLFEDKVPVSLDRWSFEKRNCPIYPQLRYRLALAKALLQDHSKDDEIEIQIEMTPNRWTGVKKTINLKGWSEINQYLSDTFYVNTEARRISTE